MSSNSNSESCSPPSKRPRTCETQNGVAGQVNNGVSLEGPFERPRLAYIVAQSKCNLFNVKVYFAISWFNTF